VRWNRRDDFAGVSIVPMTTPDPTAVPDLAPAMRHFTAGQFADAERACDAILASQPDCARALHLKGAIAARRGRLDEAIELIRRATDVDHDFLDAWLDLANLLGQAKREEEALDSLQSVARLRPDPIALVRLADLLRKRGRSRDAIAHYEKAAQVSPSDISLLCRVSNALIELKEFKRAEPVARDAVRLGPGLAGPHLNLGVALHLQNRLAEAIAEYELAIRFDPTSAVTHGNLSDLLARLDRLAEAEAAARKAVELQPASTDQWSNLAAILARMDRYEDALAAARRAIELAPDNYRAHATAGLVLLMMGRMVEAWPEFEWRTHEWATPTDRKQWDGSPLNGQPIVLRSEQGFGDTIQFIRYASMVKQRGGRVLVECSPLLKDLIATAPGVDGVFAWDGDAPNVNIEVWMMSLPHYFATTPEKIPATVPYLKHDPARADRLRPFTEIPTGLKVGLIWAGNPDHLNDRNRSCPLSALAPLTQIPGVQCFNLQKGVAAERDAALAAQLGLIDLARNCNDFADLAAAMSLMDLIISVDTAPAHLAGALARPVWLLLPRAAEWRWNLDPERSRWYSTMRLFRQPSTGDWDAVIQQVASTIEDRLHSAAT
jgi:tetratricopeptide (TPR) repeat protein